jgi:hypothetical protein
VEASFLEQPITAPRGMNKPVLVRDDSIVDGFNAHHDSDDVVKIVLKIPPFPTILLDLIPNQTKCLLHDTPPFLKQGPLKIFCKIP